MEIIVSSGGNVGEQISRVTIQGLRTSDPGSLSVLVQDVLHLPMSQIDPGCLMDLMALAELQDQLPKQLATDLGEFGKRVVRELADLPDGPPLASFCSDLAGLKATEVPGNMRAAVETLSGERSSADASAGIDSLLANLKGTEPNVISLPKTAPKGSAEAKTKVVAAKAAPKKKRRRSTIVDDTRAEWITEDVLSRVVKYGNRGLKEHVIVAGCRHRSPFKDLTEAEVLAVLRRMKREGRIRHSAGRWMKF